MATYIGISDSNGDFTIPFTQNYTGGQKVTVKASKEGAEKTIELYAPSTAVGGGVIRFNGNLTNFPNNIGVVVVSEITGVIDQYSFSASTNANQLWNKATGLIIDDGVTSLGVYSFANWASSKSLKLAKTITTVGANSFEAWLIAESIDFGLSTNLTTIGAGSFNNWRKLKKITIPDTVTNIDSLAFYNCTSATSLTIGLLVSTIATSAFANMTSCLEITCLRGTPPTITFNTFSGLRAGCIFKVPSSSLTAYQTAANWSAFASQMVGV